MAFSRIAREARTVEAMIRIYCRDHHRAANHGASGERASVSRQLCPECDELLNYARQRLGRCPFQEGKTTCVKCPVHCYTAEMREKIRTVMRYAGPRMIGRHPVLTVYHFWDGRRKEPLKKTPTNK